MRDDDPGVAQLQRWQESGGRWRVLTRTTDTVVIALLSCDIGEEVDRLSGTGPALLAYLGDRDNSEDDITFAPPMRPGTTTVVRDRDITGKPRNSRPRNAVGRPLQPGAPGVPSIPDDLNPAPAEALQQAQKLLDDGFPFHAHEILEAAWKSASHTAADQTLQPQMSSSDAVRRSRRWRWCRRAVRTCQQDRTASFLLRSSTVARSSESDRAVKAAVITARSPRPGRAAVRWRMVLVRPVRQAGCRKREPGVRPGLPRSGEWERKPS